MEKIFLSWKDYRAALKDICQQIDFNKVDVIVGLTRGGLTPATNLSYYHHKRMLTLHCSFRDYEDLDTYNKDLSEVKKYNNILIVDDICNTGKSINKIKKDLKGKNIQFCTIYAPDNEIVDYYSITIKPNTWVVFPWETM